MQHKSSILAGVLLGLLAGAQGQKFTDSQRQGAQDMLHHIASDVKKNYYDPNLHGFDLDARVREADEKLKTAGSLSQAFSIIGWTLDGLNDSHTYFVPPGRTYRLEYGWQMQMFGDRCYVLHVKPKSDAESKGLKPGDEVLSVNGIAPTRDNFYTMEYIYNVLAPRAVMKLVLRGNDGQQRQLDIQSKATQLPKLVDPVRDMWDFVRGWENAEHQFRWRCVTVGDPLAICKIPVFQIDPDKIHQLFDQARKHPALILDLRGNPGGSVNTLRDVVSGFFDHEVKIADRAGRKELKPQIAKASHEAFRGKLIVLVDSQSSSAAEIFARVVQLEKRGVVLGDRSSGLVMEGRLYDHQLGIQNVAWYGALITDADVIMTDGKSLEHRGVVPDEVLLPASADLASGKDPVMARAAEMVGVSLSPEKAGQLFPYEWPKD